MKCIYNNIFLNILEVRILVIYILYVYFGVICTCQI